MNLELENDNIELETDNQWQQYYDYMQWLCIHKSCTDTENFIIDSIIVEMTTGAVSDVNFAEITTFPPKGISGLLLIIVSSSRPAPKSNAISATKSLLSNLSLTERENVPSVSIALACNGRKCSPQVHRKYPLLICPSSQDCFTVSLHSPKGRQFAWQIACH